MPYTVKGNCVYKKDGGAKVGCTKGSVKDYLAALHANANESISETNILKGGKADKIRNIDDLYDYWAKKGYAKNGISKSLRKELEHEIALGKKIEREHTSSEKKILEIVFDHLVEDQEYYTKAKPKDWAKKEIKKELKEDTKSLIKRLLRENIERPFTEEYFKTRIPFLKDYNFFSDMRKQGTVTAQRIVFHKNVEKVYDNSVVVFPQFNPVSNFTYHTDNNGDRTSHRFSLKNSFAIMQPSNMDDLDFRVYLMAMKQMDDKLSFYDEIILRNGEQLSQTVIDKIINGLNEKMFKFEEVANQHNAPLY